MSVLETVIQMPQSGANSLASYLAAYVLLCLVPAFFIAGATSALVPKGIITRYLGPNAPKRLAYPMAALGRLLFSVCSCTILSLRARYYRRSALFRLSRSIWKVDCRHSGGIQRRSTRSGLCRHHGSGPARCSQVQR
jgi:uncharacterized membrane protein YraQ (UPF0718 family)